MLRAALALESNIININMKVDVVDTTFASSQKAEKYANVTLNRSTELFILPRYRL